MVKIGVIGCGRIAQLRHLPEFASNPDAELIAVYDRTKERAEEIAENYHCKVCQTAEELIADEEIDAVSICVANVLHAELTIKALKAGKHVLCEKPMASTIEECKAMVRAAEDSGKILMIAQNQRFDPVHRKAKQLLEQGVIGKVLTFRSSFGHSGPENWSIHQGPKTWFFDKKQAAMGAMADLGIHKTDLIQYLLDDTVVETSAKITTLDKRDAEGNPISVDDNAICIYRMSSGVIGTMTASWTYYGGQDNSTVFYGTEGTMKIYENPDRPLEVVHRDGSRDGYDFEQTDRSGVIDAFVKAVETGSASPVSPESALSAMRAVFDSIKSSETGHSVSVNTDG